MSGLPFKFVVIHAVQTSIAPLLLKHCGIGHLKTRLGGGGVLSGKVDTGMCGPGRVPFWPLRFTNGPLFFFYLRIGF